NYTEGPSENASAVIGIDVPTSGNNNNNNPTSTPVPATATPVPTATVIPSNFPSQLPVTGAEIESQGGPTLTIAQRFAAASDSLKLATVLLGALLIGLVIVVFGILMRMSWTDGIRRSLAKREWRLLLWLTAIMLAISIIGLAALGTSWLEAEPVGPLPTLV